MKVRGTLWILLASTTTLASIADDKTDSSNAGRSIEIKPAKTLFVLGGPIDLGVVYSNPPGEPWKLEQPESSAGVKVWYEPVGKGNSARMGFSFSKMTIKQVRLPDGRDQRVYAAPPRTEIEIQPGAKHELTVDIYSKWTEDLAPGEYEVWVEDVGQKLKSNRCTFTLAFNKESVPLLLETASAEKEMPAKRKWCAHWLQKLKPDFELKIKGDKDSPEAVRKMAEENAAAIRGFKEHWEKVKSSRETESLFAKPAPRADARQQAPENRKKGSP